MAAGTNNIKNVFGIAMCTASATNIPDGEAADSEEAWTIESAANAMTKWTKASGGTNAGYDETGDGSLQKAGCLFVPESADHKGLQLSFLVQPVVLFARPDGT